MFELYYLNNVFALNADLKQNLRFIFHFRLITFYTYIWKICI